MSSAPRMAKTAEPRRIDHSSIHVYSPPRNVPHLIFSFRERGGTVVRYIALTFSTLNHRSLLTHSHSMICSSCLFLFESSDSFLPIPEVFPACYVYYLLYLLYRPPGSFTPCVPWMMHGCMGEPREMQTVQTCKRAPPPVKIV